MQYQWNDRLALRGGVEDRPSVIPADVADLSVPIADSVLYSMGAEYRYDKKTVIDFALSYMKSDNYVPAESSKANNQYELFAQYPSLDLEYSIETVQFLMAWKKDF